MKIGVFHSVFKIKASSTAQDWQVFRRTGNFSRIIISCSSWSLTHWGWVTHICIGNLTITGLSPGWRQFIIWTNAGILLIGPLGTNFIEILTEIHVLFKKMYLKMLSVKWRPSFPGLSVLNHCRTDIFSGLSLSNVFAVWTMMNE